mgnify:CR=1 FL=1
MTLEIQFTWGLVSLMSGINKFSLCDPCSYEFYIRNSKKGLKNSGLSCCYLSRAHNCKEHTLKIHFSGQIKKDQEKAKK